MHHQPFRPPPSNDQATTAFAAHHNSDLEDDTDDIVGSYLQDSSSFLNAWSQSMNQSSSHNDFQAPITEPQISTWTPPSWHATRNPSHPSSQQQQQYPQDSSFSRTTTSNPPPAMSASSSSQAPNSAQPSGATQVPSSSSRTVRKSPSNRKLKPQTSMSNLTNAAATTGGGPPTSLPDPSLFPDPYPSGFSAANASTTPPVSLFSAGSSSARSSAYTSASPASALRSSVASSDSAHNARHQRPSSQHHPHSNTRLSAGDGMASIGGLPQSLGHSYLLDHASSDQASSPALSMQQFGFLNAIDRSSPSQVGLASTTDEGVQLRDVDQQLHSAVTARPGFASAPGSRPATEYTNFDKTRWSSSDAASRESKTSSWGNFNARAGRSGADGPYDEWGHEPTGEREEDYHSDDDLGNEDDDMDRTTAVVLAEQGHGEIVHGEGRDVNELNVPNNTTHLLLGSCATPNQLPHFLVNVLPPISHSLLVLDVSTCFLSSLPPQLAACRNLEELNVASNPLRVLPTWLAVLTNLRVLIADSIGMSTLPPSLSAAVQLHTLSIRGNRMYSLPCWLCLLPALETLYLDGNPFQGPWRALVEPLIPRPVAVNPNTPSVKSPFYPPNTPHTANSFESTDPSEYSEDRHDENMVRQRQGSIPWTKGHHTTSSKELNMAFLPPGQGGNNHAQNNPSGVRSRALTLDRDREDARLGVATAGARARLLSQDPQSPRPHTSFSTHDAVGARSLSRTKTAPSKRPSASNSITSLIQQSGESTPPPVVGRNSPSATAMLATAFANGGGTPSFSRLNSGAKSSEVLTLQTSSLNQPGEGMNEILERGMSPNTMRRMRSAGDMRLSPALGGMQSQGERTPDEMGSFGGQDNTAGLGKFMSVGARGPMREEYKALTATMFEPPTSSSLLSQSTVKGKKEEGEKRKWGFLKKVSKGRLRSGSVSQGDDSGPQGGAIGSQGYVIGPPRTMGGMGGPSASLPLVPHTSAGNTTPGIPQRPMTATGAGSRSTPTLNQQTSPQRRVLSKRPTDPAAHTSMISSHSSNTPSTPSTMSMFSTRSMVQPTLSTLNTSARPSTSSGLLAPPSATSLTTPRKTKRRSFLPLGGPSPISIPSHDNNVLLVSGSPEPGDGGLESPGYPRSPISPIMESEEKQRERHQRALKSVMGYLRDMCDLSAGTSMGATAVAAAAANAQSQVNSNPNFSQSSYQPDSHPSSRGPSSRSVSRRPTLSGQDAARALSDFNGSSMPPSLPTGSSFTNQLQSMLSDMSSPMKDGEDTAADSSHQPQAEEKKVKDDKNKRAMIVKEIVSTERTYVKLLTELVDIYVKPASVPVTGIASSKETVVPATERKVVFNGLESLLSFHKDSFLPSLEQAALTLEASDDADGRASTQAANKVAQVFVSHAAFMRMYSTYINNFDNSMRRTKQWTDKSIAAVVASSTTASGIAANAANAEANAQSNLTPSQKKRIKQYLKKCRAHPKHSQMNMEAYLLLPVQRIPRYRLLFEELVRATPPNPDMPDVLQKALDEITVLASNMNEGKREAESRRKLVQWQGRIRGKFPSPLVQPHRRLIMDGRLQLTRVVRKMVNYFEVMGAGGEKTLISVECLAPEVTPRALTAILCNDLLVLCKDPSGGKDPMGPVDLWAVLRMQTVPQPASIVHGSALRLVDNKAILYFDLPSTTESLTWSRAINMHIPASSK